MIDLEAEYNNRARVPEHPQIFARWVREAARARALRQANWAFDIAYGPGERQRYDYLAAHGDTKRPIIVFIHGGYWQSLGKSSFSHLAAGASAHGLDVAVAGYTLCPETTVGGIVEEMRLFVNHLASSTGRRLVIAGHSAGGHLAAVLAATDWSRAGNGLSFDPVAAAMPISGLYELEPLIMTSINTKLGLDRTTAEALSPRFMPAPKGKRVVCVVGAVESSEFLRQQRVFVEEWGHKGSAIRGVEVNGADHFTVIEPLADENSDLTRAIVSLAAI